jgi:hypothetical protein
MTAIQIQRRILRDHYRQSFVLPNYTPRGWWECDVFQITKAGYFVEYEIKLSLADFKADADKRKSPRWQFNGEFSTARNKHEDLKARSPLGPSRFYYVAPAGLLPTNMIPEWAGLIEARESKHEIPFVGEIKKAPRLHSQKPEPSIVEHAKGVCYWRMHGLFIWRRVGMTPVEQVV